MKVSGGVKWSYEKKWESWKNVRGTENESTQPCMERNAIHPSRGLTNSSPSGSDEANQSGPHRFRLLIVGILV